MSSQSRSSKSVPGQKQLTSFRKAITTFAGITKCDISANWTYQAAKLYATHQFGSEFDFSNVDDTDSTNKDELFLIFLTAWRKHVTAADMTYPTLEAFKIYYEKHIDMNQLPPAEICRLHNWANWVNLALRALSNRRGYKSTLLRILPRILEKLPNTPPYKYKSIGGRIKQIDIDSLNRNTIYDMEIGKCARCVESNDVKEQFKRQHRKGVVIGVETSNASNTDIISSFSKNCVTPSNRSSEIAENSEFDQSYHNPPIPHLDTSYSTLDSLEPSYIDGLDKLSDSSVSVMETPVTPQREDDSALFNNAGANSTDESHGPPLDHCWLPSPDYSTNDSTSTIRFLPPLSEGISNQTTPADRSVKRLKTHQRTPKDHVWEYDNGDDHDIYPAFEPMLTDANSIDVDSDTQPFSHHAQYGHHSPERISTSKRKAKAMSVTPIVSSSSSSAENGSVAKHSIRTRSVTRASAITADQLQEAGTNREVSGSIGGEVTGTNGTNGNASRELEPIAQAGGVTFIPPPTSIQRDTSFLHWLGNTLSEEQVTVGLPVLCISNSPLCSPRGTAEYVPSIGDCQDHDQSLHDEKESVVTSKDWEIFGSSPLYPAIDAQSVGFLGTTMLLSPKDTMTSIDSVSQHCGE